MRSYGKVHIHTSAHTHTHARTHTLNTPTHNLYKYNRVPTSKLLHVARF